MRVFPGLLPAAPANHRGSADFTVGQSINVSMHMTGAASQLVHK